MGELRDKWNARYTTSSSEPVAVQVLRENLHLLPASGKALDVACGLGGNAIELARHGLQVDAYDISDVAIASLQQRSKQENLNINASVHDVEQLPPEAGRYDVIVVSYFLARPLMPALVAALKPGGLIYYQTFSQIKVSDRGPQNQEYRLAQQELLQLLSDCLLLVYREEARVGDLSQGVRDEVMYIGMRKPD